ncbi:TlpA disulfide reductase family protein [Roseovarius arcticus]|uniref:TlpA disulfide reductase family protein n=1 Tax=Roseovarius arcticus TaxID=2547404 RepID=UPI00111041C0|nr:TlpA disulfide reductase family protein [Roseovarius arcticus]
MNAIAIGPLIFSNDRFIAILSIAAFLLVSEFFAWRRPDTAKAIRRWSMITVVTWIVAARLGFVISNFDVFAEEPLSVFALWQGGFDTRAGTFGLGVTIFLGMLLTPSVVKPIAVSLLLGGMTFQTAGFLLPYEPRGRIPSVSFADLEGNEIGLARDDGKPLVLNLWATWCPPCRREMPMMVRVAAAQENVAFIFANQGEHEETVQSYLRYNGLPIEGMVQDPDSTLLAKFGMLGLPSTLFFSADGQLKAVHTGEISRAALLAQIKELEGESDED